MQGCEGAYGPCTSAGCTGGWPHEVRGCSSQGGGGKVQSQLLGFVMRANEPYTSAGCSGGWPHEVRGCNSLYLAATCW